MKSIKIKKMIRKKNERRTAPSLCPRVLSFLMVACILFNVGIACLYPQVVYASFSGTVAGYILTLFASFNTAITNPNVVNAINNTFGSIALEAADAGVIDQGIAQIASTTGFDMAQIFSNTAAEAEQVVSTGWDTISTTAQTAGQNLAAGAAACAASAGAVLPAIGGAVLPAAGAVGAGIGLGILIDKARTALMDYIKGGYKVDAPKGIMTQYPTGMNYMRYSNSANHEGYYLWGYGGRACFCNSPRTVYYKNYTNSSIPYGWKNYTTGSANIGSLAPGGIATMGAGSETIYFNIPQFNTAQECRDYLNNNSTGIGTSNVSPDIVGNIGNQIGINDNENYITPYITNIYDYGNTVINYINPEDYQTLVDDANDNTDIGDIGEDTQGETFKDFIDPYVRPIEDTPINPDNPYDELPNPQPTISPTNPTIPVQPTAAPEPTLTPEETEEMPYGMTQPKLSDKFPFCIPFDIAYLFAIFSDEREAPHFVWTLDLGTWGKYEIEVDLAPFNSVASIFRLCELTLFILGLMLMTKSLLSSSDGG